MLKSLGLATLMVFGLVNALVAEDRSGTLPINGLDMYYEIHGEGEPLVLLHGAYMNIPINWDALIPTLAETRQVIAVELQGHGRTSDRDTPITYEGMADDVAALMDALEIEDAAIFGYSMGAGVAIQMAFRHPEKVDRLIAASAAINYDALPEGFYEMIETMSPEMFAGSPLETEYQKYAPNPEGFSTLVEKLKALDLDRFAWSEEQFAAIDVPTLLIFGDEDIVSMEHAVKMFRLLGAKGNGDMNGLPKVQLAVLPGTAHTGVVAGNNVEYLKTMIPSFLEQELPAAPAMPF